MLYNSCPSHLVIVKDICSFSVLLGQVYVTQVQSLILYNWAALSLSFRLISILYVNEHNSLQSGPQVNIILKRKLLQKLYCTRVIETLQMPIEIKQTWIISQPKQFKISQNSIRVNTTEQITKKWDANNYTNSAQIFTRTRRHLA